MTHYELVRWMVETPSRDVERDIIMSHGVTSRDVH